MKRKCDVLLICGDGDRGYTFRGKAYAQYLDTLGDMLEKRGLRVLSAVKPGSSLSGSKAYRSPVLIKTPALQWFYRLRDWIRYRQIAWSKFLGLSRKFVIASNQDYIYRKFLEKFSPSVVIGISPQASLSRTAKRMGIRVYDMQHGVIVDDHPDYGLRFREKRERETLPDGYLCWDESSADTIQAWANEKNISVKVIGNPWFTRFIKNSEDDELVKDAFSSRPVFDQNRPNILVTFTWTEVQYPFQDFIHKLIIASGNDYNWLIRLHPVSLKNGESEKIIQLLTDNLRGIKNIEWKRSSEEPLPVVLSWTDVHITYDSTVVTEASWVGMYSCILDQEIADGGIRSSYYQKERAIGMAEVQPLDIRAVQDWIKRTLGKGKTTPLFKITDAAMEDFLSEVIHYQAIKPGK